MGKIPGWTKRHDKMNVESGMRELKYTSDKSASILYIVHPGHTWEVWLTDVFNDEMGGEMIYHHPNKYGAMKFALKYMKENPSG